MCLHQRLDVFAVPVDPPLRLGTHKCLHVVSVPSQRQGDHGYGTLADSCLLPQRSWYWQRHPACQIQAGGWPTLSNFYWRPGGKRPISHAGMKVMCFEMQYHINQPLNVTVPIPAAFTQADGKCCCNTGLAWCVFECVLRYVFISLDGA